MEEWGKCAVIMADQSMWAGDRLRHEVHVSQEVLHSPEHTINIPAATTSLFYFPTTSGPAVKQGRN